MTVRRLVLTVVAMSGVAVLLAALTPPVPAMADALSHPQRTVDRTGPEALVVPGVAALAWLCWAWGALGLGLTAASALPGVCGRLAGTALHVVLPAGARRAAALLLGLGLGVAAPVLTTALPLPPAASAATPAAGPPAATPDWPVAPARVHDDVPDWPAALPQQPAGTHVVVRGDCLWSIAGKHLTERRGRVPSDAEVAVAVEGWWTANRQVIGPDPDLLLPGQVLRPPFPA